MVGFSSLIAASVAIAGASAAVRNGGAQFAVKESESVQKRLSSNSVGTSNGFYYSFWAQASGGADYENGSGGEYSLTWEESSVNVVAGKGWATGSDRTIKFDADYNPDGNSYLSVYGWTKSPLIEYYIVESWNEYNPASAATQVGTVTADGSTYTILKTTRTNAASIEGDGQTFEQYWSVRSSKRTSGTVTTATHFEAWENLGMTLGSFSSGAYQIVATEGYQSSGSSTVTVSEG